MGSNSSYYMRWCERSKTVVGTSHWSVQLRRHRQERSCTTFIHSITQLKQWVRKKGFKPEEIQEMVNHLEADRFAVET